MNTSICLNINDDMLFVFKNNNIFMRTFIANMTKMFASKSKNKCTVYEATEHDISQIVDQWVESNSLLPFSNLSSIPSMHCTKDNCLYKWDNDMINIYQIQSKPYVEKDIRKHIGDELKTKDIFSIQIFNESLLSSCKKTMTFEVHIPSNVIVYKKTLINKLKQIDFMKSYKHILLNCESVEIFLLNKRKHKNI